MEKVNRYTRAGFDGRVITCPNCGHSKTVYHFAWYALGCNGCNEMIKKTDYLTEPKKAKQ